MLNERFQLLLTKKLANELTPEEHLEFLEMVNSDPELNKIYTDLKSYWTPDEETYANNAKMFQNILNKIDSGNQSQSENVIPITRKGYSKFTRMIAAVLVTAALGAGTYYYTNYRNAVQNTKVANLEVLHTPSRQKSKIVLSDGSVVTLNSQSQLKYPASFSGKTREVYLNGEAFFDIKKDPEHPFIVHADQMKIKVLGTAFNVKSYANDESCETTLIRGAIELTLADRPADRIILKPNEKLVLHKRVTLKHTKRGNVKFPVPDTSGTSYLLTNLTHLKIGDSTVVETSWTNNKLIFKDQDMESLAKQMERWFGLKIIVKSELIKKYNYTGVFEKESITQALYALQMIEPFHYKINKEIVYIY
ncbi:FecR family protein [Mucilaginibacter gynuensis]|uniref:FecR family protein n=1 Tax=Mucilaginibacter gynuensis TaxID=1302236 RepID=A0ABP8GV13_9SPHI